MRLKLFMFIVLTACAGVSDIACDSGSGPGGDPGYFAFFTGGEFIQSDGTYSFSHEISPFLIARYEATYSLWRTVHAWATDTARGSGIYVFANQGREGHDGTEGAAPTAAQNEPVTTVSWRDAVVWCNAYSEMDGFVPVYYSDAGFTAVIRDSGDSNAAACDAAFADWDADGYRLPTEGEWQYAAGYIDGGEWTPWNCISGDSAPQYSSDTAVDYAWFDENSQETTHDTGRKSANAAGIYDMSGNVSEWCWDWYGAYPTDSADYRGPGSGSNRAARGGHWGIGGASARVGSRGMAYPYFTGGTMGFRIARNSR